MKFAACAILIASLVIAGSPHAFAETNIEYLIKTCPNGETIATIKRRTDEAHALQDSNRYQLHHELARAFYICSQLRGMSYRSDIAKLLYIDQLDMSVRTNGEEIDRGAAAVEAANELASSTKYPYIRKEALESRNRIRGYVNEANETVNGVASPAPSTDTYNVPDPQPTSR